MGSVTSSSSESSEDDTSQRDLDSGLSVTLVICVPVILGLYSAFCVLRYLSKIFYQPACYRTRFLFLIIQLKSN